MSVEVRVPSMGESVTTATVAGWLKKAGEAVKVDESLVALDSELSGVATCASLREAIAQLVSERVAPRRTAAR